MNTIIRRCVVFNVILSNSRVSLSCSCPFSRTLLYSLIFFFFLPCLVFMFKELYKGHWRRKNWRYIFARSCKSFSFKSMHFQISTETCHTPAREIQRFFFELGINYKDINSVLCSFFLQCPLQGSVHVHVSAILIAVFFTCPASVSLGKIPNPSWLHFICMSVRVCVSA